MIRGDLNNGHENSVWRLTRQRRTNTNDNLKVVLWLLWARCWQRRIVWVWSSYLRLSIGLFGSLLRWEAITVLHIWMNWCIQLLKLQLLLLLLVSEVWIWRWWLSSLLQHLVYEVLLRILVCIHRPIHLILFLVVMFLVILSAWISS